MEALVEDTDEALDVFYDKAADVLYISFGPPREADDSEMTQNDIIVRRTGGKIIGLTVLSFSKRIKQD